MHFYYILKNSLRSQNNKQIKKIKSYSYNR